MIKQRLKDNTNGKLFELLETLYSSITIALAQHELDLLIIELGVREGVPESLLLFNLFFDYVIRSWMNVLNKTLNS